MKKFKLIIPDANIIINAHKHNYWEILVKNCDLHIGSIVLHDEALFAETPRGRASINLSKDLA